MARRKVINNKYTMNSYPFGTTVVSYLLFQQLRLSGTARGALLALMILWNVLIWIVVISQIFLVEASTPLFKEDLY